VDRFSGEGLVIKTDKGQPEPAEQGKPKSGTPAMDAAIKRELSKKT
jgi:hypothetical protein